MVIKLSPKHINFLDKCNRTVAGPQQRFFLGISALAAQPAIDYFFGSKDEKTRNISLCKTISKIIVGTSTGIIVRILAIKHSDKLLSADFIKKLFPEFLKSTEKKLLLQKSLGDIIALGVCLITNFLIDAPLTKLSTNYLIKKFVNKEKE